MEANLNARATFQGRGVAARWALCLFDSFLCHVPLRAVDYVHNSVYLRQQSVYKESTMNNVQTLPVSEAKQRLTLLVKSSEELFDKFLITRNGRSSAMLMSAEEYDGLMETLDILGHRKEVRAIAEGSKQARAGRTLSLDRYLARVRKPVRRTKRT
jgi:antitoxin YefM